jgi:hypothetical protein
MNIFKLLSVEYNNLNGFIAQILYLDFEFKTSRLEIEVEGSLLGLNISNDFVYIDLLFMTVILYDNSGLE